MSPTRQMWRRALRRYAFYGLIWTGVFVLSWYTYQRGGRLGGTAEWAGLLQPVVFGLTVWPILRRFARGERWLTIPNAVLGLTYLTIGLGAVYFVLNYEDLHYAALRRPDEVRTALLVAMAGVVAYRVGAEVPCFRGLVRRLPNLPSTPRWSWGVRLGVFVAIGLAVCAKLYLAATGSLGYVTSGSSIGATGVGSLISFLTQIGLLALTGAYYYWFLGAPLSTGDKTFVVVSTATLALLGLLSGMKSEFLFVFFGVAIPYMWVRGRRRTLRSSRTKEASFALGLVGFMILLFAINPIYRGALNELQAEESRLEQASTATAFVLTRVSAGEGLLPLFATGAENAWGRLSIFPYHLAVVEQVPDARPYRGFDRYPLLPAMTVVPRVMWPGKPANTSGQEFQRDFISSRVVFSTTPTVYGWSYMELGLAGVVVVLFCLGLLAALVEGYLAEAQRGKLAAILLYTAMFVGLAEVEADPFWMLGGVPKLTVIAALVFALFALPRMLGRRAPRSRGSLGSA